MFTKRHITVYQTILVLLFLIALWLRLFNLGRNPLSNSEATPALSALHILQHHQNQSSNQPLYISFTSILFDFFGSNNFIARLLPALAGSILIPALGLFTHKINKVEILIVALLLIIDPVFLSLSRQADSRILVVVLLIISFGFLLQRQYSIAGVSSALLILSGIYFWHVLLILVFFLLFRKLFYKITEKREADDYINIVLNDKENLKKYFLYLSVSIIIIGTRFLSAPFLLSQVTQSFLDYFSGWVNLSGAFDHLRILLLVLFTYYPLIILFGLIGLISMLLERDPQTHSLLLFFIFSLTITLTYPTAKHVDIVFILPFLYYFFAKFLVKLIQKFKNNVSKNIFALIPFLFLMGILGLFLLNTMNITTEVERIEQQLIAIIGCLLLLGLIFILVSWGWSFQYAFNGFAIALVLILGFSHLSSALHLVGVSPRPEAEVWWLDGYFKDADLLLDSIEKISIMNSGIKNNIYVAIEGSSSPSVNWLLKEYRFMNFKKIPFYLTPQIIITKDEISQRLNEEYRGSKFTLKAKPYRIANSDAFFAANDLLSYLIPGKNIIENEEIYLWARADLFPGNNIKFENTNKD